MMALCWSVVKVASLMRSRMVSRSAKVPKFGGNVVGEGRVDRTFEGLTAFRLAHKIIPQIKSESDGLRGIVGQCFSQ